MGKKKKKRKKTEGTTQAVCEMAAYIVSIYRCLCCGNVLYRFKGGDRIGRDGTDRHHHSTGDQILQPREDHERYGEFRYKLRTGAEGAFEGTSASLCPADENGRFVWCNSEFQKLIGKETPFGKSITSYIPELTKDRLPAGRGTGNTGIFHWETGISRLI